MNVPTLALPATPLSAIDGVPAACALPTALSRRRYAQTVALALLDRACWATSTWRRDLGEECPPLLRARAVAEDWPLTTIDQHGVSVTILLRPVAFGDDLTALVDEAVEELPAELRAEAGAVLRALASGEYPSMVADAVNGAFGDAVFSAGQAGHAAKSQSFELAIRVCRQQAAGA